VQDRLREQARTWGAAAAVAALLSLLSATLLEGLISGPIRRLGRVVDEIDPAQTGGRRASTDTRDEVGQLALAFNRLLDRLEEQTDRLRLQAEYNEVLFKQSPLPIIVIDPRAGRLTDCNDAAIAIYGLGSREATLACTADEVSTPLQYDGTPSAEAAKAHTTAALDGNAQVYDWRHQRPDGSIFDAEVHLARFGTAEAPLLLTSLFDVTERKAAAAELQRLNEALETRVVERTRDLAVSNTELSATIEQLQRAQSELVRSERLASLGSLVAGVAHELNTPLGSVLLVATTLGDGIEELRLQLERGDLKRSSLADFLAQQAQAQALIVRNARRAAELIGRFKQVAVDQTSEQRRRFDLAEVVAEVLETLQPQLRSTPHRIEVALAEGLVMDSYPGPIGQILTNLVMNAVIHGLEGKAGVVRVAARALSDDEIELLVSDNGAGVPIEDHARIFDPFFTTKLGEGGSGLGLHIVFSLVERTLGGRVSLDSHPGQGATFTLRLPRIAPKLQAT
jgi:PAS domain S-box-containing protein